VEAFSVLIRETDEHGKKQLERFTFFLESLDPK
jgi:hypothetical protein